MAADWYCRFSQSNLPRNSVRTYVQKKKRHIRIHTHTHTHTHAQSHTVTHKFIHTYTHTRIHAYTHTHTYTHAHAYSTHTTAIEPPHPPHLSSKISETRGGTPTNILLQGFKRDAPNEKEKCERRGDFFTISCMPGQGCNKKFLLVHFLKFKVADAEFGLHDAHLPQRDLQRLEEHRTE